MTQLNSFLERAAPSTLRVFRVARPASPPNPLAGGLAFFLRHAAALATGISLTSHWPQTVRKHADACR